MIKKRKLLKKLLFVTLISLFFSSCSFTKINGNFNGDQYSIGNKIEFITDLCYGVKIKNSISQPYNFQTELNESIPNYAEIALLFDF